MAFTLNPDLQPALAAMMASLSPTDLPRPGDTLGLRALIDASVSSSFKILPANDAITMTPYDISAKEGGITLRWYQVPGRSSNAAVVYAHGGGMLGGSAAAYDRLLRYYVATSGVSFLSVDYRLAPEFRETGLAQDVYAGLQWLIANAPELGIDAAHIAVMGDSGGGCLAAAAAILAREHGLLLARQILIYPMLDDRTVEPDPLIAPFALWSYENNQTAWSAVLGGSPAFEAASPYLVPARLQDFEGLAPAYVEVGELDIFRDESIAYARNLWAAGVPCSLRVHAGVPHGFELLGWGSPLVSAAIDERIRLIVAI